MPSIRSIPGFRGPVSGTLIPALAILLAPSLVSPRLSGVAAAEEAPKGAPREKGRIELSARLEPADLPPGGSGWVVVTARLGDLHVYADEDSALTWRPFPAPGVTYGTPETPVAYEQRPSGVEMTAPHEYRDPDVPEDAYLVWEERFELKVPVTLAASAAPGTEVGLLLDYSGCDKAQCYKRQKGQKVTARTAGTPASVPADGTTGGTAGPVGAGGRPKIRGGCGDGSAEVVLDVTEDAQGQGTATVTFRPKLGWHLYLPGEDGLPIEVLPKQGAGVVWGEVPPFPATGAFHEPYAVKVPYTRTSATVLSLEVRWQGCSDGAGGTCLRQEECTLTAAFDPAQGAMEAAVPPPGPAPAAGGGDPATSSPPGTGPGTDTVGPPTVEVEAPTGGLMFPVIPGEPLEHLSGIEEMWREKGLLTLLILFGIGMGLAFTPCVLPIIPLTVSVISGGRADLPKARLTVLLVTYVVGLTLAFGSLGLVASLAGTSMSAAFQSPIATWIIAGIFAVLAFGMLGVYEMQPPQWMLRLQGGAQQRGGSVVGAFLLGAISAVLASPCTAPVVAGLLVFTAKAGNAVLGFSMFSTVGLGMGAIFFVAGSMNFLLRPGPWMVWVRYVFGVLLVGVALYYVANSELISPTVLFVGGFSIAILAWALIALHLIRKEGAPAKEAQTRGFQVALLLVAATAGVAFLTKPAAAAEGLQKLEWTKVRDREHLRQEVEAAVLAGRPVVVDVWATWCAYCKKYEALINEREALNVGFAKMTRLKIDVSKDDREDLRSAVGIPVGKQPRMAFLDRKGRIHRAADVVEWYEDKDGSTEALQKRIDLLVGGAADGK